VSPDGTLIAFEDASRGRGLWVMARDGSGARHVFGEWTRPYAFAWAPDGEHLFFAQGDGWLYVIGTDGSGLARWAEGLAAAPRP
jgi:hypothetical protein